MATDTNHEHTVHSMPSLERVLRITTEQASDLIDQIETLEKKAGAGMWAKG